ncbi:TRAP transporter small permease subunit [Catenovulum sp. 2E275]|uniref:TRAP transporter small permease n=1 Tax=Catenovulum sp. 2E275 TaxID=2980497 RepID=UPI0021CF88C6|nr:TRAP transporter small permease subunit [Catenovulum sp. 2E275]MCU4677702.1 TRAP transporter small permease subunit [Catenovulum sp. 2E275]
MWNKLERQITALLLFLIVVLVFAAAVMRTLGYPIIWSVDFAQLLFVWLAVLGSDQALKQGNHAKLDVFFNKLQLKNRIKLAGLLNMISIACLFAVLIYGIELVLLNPLRTLGSTDLPYALVTAAMPVGAGLMMITLIFQSKDLWIYWYKPEQFGDLLEMPPHLQKLLQSQAPEPIKSGKTGGEQL